jgi:hypothetical protein
MTFTTPRGCFALNRNQPLDRNALDRDPGLNEQPALKALVEREQQLDLLDFEFSPAPVAMVPPAEGCEQLWARYHSGGASNMSSDTRLVSWRALMSDRAMAAGLQPGQSFIYRRQALIAIGKMTVRDERTTRVEYTWHWEPTFEGAHLGIAASEPSRSTATFTRDGTEWRLKR